MLETHAFLELGRGLVRNERCAIDAGSEIERSTHLPLQPSADDRARQRSEIAEREHAEAHEQSAAFVAER